MVMISSFFYHNTNLISFSTKVSFLDRLHYTQHLLIDTRRLGLCDNGKSYISICCVKIMSINDISR